MARSARRVFYDTAPGGDLGEFPRFGIQLRQLDELRSLLASTPRLLDIGCATGTWSTRVGEALGARAVVGVDLSAPALAEAAGRGMGAVLGSADGALLPFRDDVFDVVTLNEVIEHVVDTDGLLDEIRRVLTPGGALVMSTPNLAAWFNRLALIGGVQPAFTEVGFSGIYGRPGSEVVGHLRVFTWRALREFLAAHGYTVVGATGAPYHDLPRPLRPLDRFVARWPTLAADLLVVARP